jgi:hypothetical protein
MELSIYADKFVISYAPLWMLVLLFSGLILFIISKQWRTRLYKQHRHSFLPGVLFSVSFIFLMGGINLYVYKIVMDKDKITLFTIEYFNQQIKWSDISHVRYKDKQRIVIESNTLSPSERMLIELQKLDAESFNKVKILINLKIKQNKSLKR